MKESRAQVIASIALLSEVAESELFEPPLGTPAVAGVQDRVLAAYLKPRQYRHWALLESLVVFDDVLYDSYLSRFSHSTRTSLLKTRRDRFSFDLFPKG
jgi:hypothetical protein